MLVAFDAPAISANIASAQVHPKRLDIPPHEYRYVTVYFSPKAIRSFAAVFEALVENGASADGRPF